MSNNDFMLNTTIKDYKKQLEITKEVIEEVLQKIEHDTENQKIYTC